MQRVSNRLVSMLAHHPTNNRLGVLGLLLAGGREVVRWWGRHTIRVQPDAEFGLGPTEQVRFVLGQQIRPIRPLRSWLVNPFDDHPDEAGIGGGAVRTVTPSSYVGSSLRRKGCRVALSYCAGNIIVSFSSLHTAQRSCLSLSSQRCQRR